MSDQYLKKAFSDLGLYELGTSISKKENSLMCKIKLYELYATLTETSEAKNVACYLQRGDFFFLIQRNDRMH